MRKISKTKLYITVVISLLIHSLSLASTADGPLPSFIVGGVEFPLEKVPELEGHWQSTEGSSMNNQGRVAIKQGFYLVNLDSRKCGLDKRKLIKAFLNEDDLFLEIGPSNDQLRCPNTTGMIANVNLKNKRGFYRIKASASDVVLGMSVTPTGKLEFN